jgi:hypothetical protein
MSKSGIEKLKGVYTSNVILEDRADKVATVKLQTFIRTLVASPN